jgi:phage/conjugal plasmid C-4 type zinc finger TraR family protein
MDEADLGNMFAEKYLRGEIARAVGANNHLPAHGANDGVCDDCGEIIPLPRREAVPGCRLCIDCQRDREREA